MKYTKIPLWPLYVADALMFLAVITIAVQNGRYTEISWGTTFFCCLMVFAGMVMLLVPYWLDFKRDLARKAEHSKEVAENFDIIFEQLASLQSMIADNVEHTEAIEEKIQDSNGSSDNEAFKNAVIEFKDAVKAKLKILIEADQTNAEAIADLKKSVNECENAALDSKQIANNVANSLDEIKTSTEQSDRIVTEIADDLTILKDLFEGANESLSDEISQLSKNFADIQERMNNLEEDNKFQPVSNPSETISVGKLSGLLDKALSGVQLSKGSVEKFVSHNKPESEKKPTSQEDEIQAQANNETFAEGGTEMGLNVPEDEEEYQSPELKPQSEEIEDKPTQQEDDVQNAENNVVFTETGTQLGDFEDLEKDSSPELNQEQLDSKKEKKPDNFVDDLNFFDLAGSVKDKTESAIKKSKSTSSNEQDLLFEALPESQSKVKKASKGQTAVILNALIGIGNKPYLRGTGGGLSESKGVVMNYVEIGKWQYIFDEDSSAIKFVVLKNDETASDENETFTVNSGERLEINLTFPQH